MGILGQAIVAKGKYSVDPTQTFGRMAQREANSKMMLGKLVKNYAVGVKKNKDAYREAAGKQSQASSERLATETALGYKSGTINAEASKINSEISGLYSELNSTPAWKTKEIKRISSEIDSKAQNLDTFLNKSHAYFEGYKELNKDINDPEKYDLNSQVSFEKLPQALQDKLQTESPDEDFTGQKYYASEVWSHITASDSPIYPHDEINTFMDGARVRVDNITDFSLNAITDSLDGNLYSVNDEGVVVRNEDATAQANTLWKSTEAAPAVNQYIKDFKDGSFTSVEGITDNKTLLTIPEVASIFHTDEFEVPTDESMEGRNPAQMAARKARFEKENEKIRTSNANGVTSMAALTNIDEAADYQGTNGYNSLINAIKESDATPQEKKNAITRINQHIEATKYEALTEHSLSLQNKDEKGLMEKYNKTQAEKKKITDAQDKEDDKTRAFDLNAGTVDIGGHSINVDYHGGAAQKGKLTVPIADLYNPQTGEMLTDKDKYLYYDNGYIIGNVNDDGYYQEDGTGKGVNRVVKVIEKDALLNSIMKKRGVEKSEANKIQESMTEEERNDLIMNLGADQISYLYLNQDNFNSIDKPGSNDIMNKRMLNTVNSITGEVTEEVVETPTTNTAPVVVKSSDGVEMTQEEIEIGIKNLAKEKNISTEEAIKILKENNKLPANYGEVVVDEQETTEEVVVDEKETEEDISKRTGPVQIAVSTDGNSTGGLSNDDELLIEKLGYTLVMRTGTEEDGSGEVVYYEIESKDGETQQEIAQKLKDNGFKDSFVTKGIPGENPYDLNNKEEKEATEEVDKSNMATFNSWNEWIDNGSGKSGNGTFVVDGNEYHFGDDGLIHGPNPDGSIMTKPEVVVTEETTEKKEVAVGATDNSNKEEGSNILTFDSWDDVKGIDTEETFIVGGEEFHYIGNDLRDGPNPGTTEEEGAEGETSEETTKEGKENSSVITQEETPVIKNIEEKVVEKVITNNPILQKATETEGSEGNGENMNPVQWLIGSGFIGTNEAESDTTLVKTVNNVFDELLGEANPTSELPLTSDDKAWCGALVYEVLTSTNAIPEFSGKKSSEPAYNKLRANEYLKVGTGVKDPKIGDIMVQKYADGKSHVGFYAGLNDEGEILMLGGNQSNKVSYKVVPKSEVAGYRRLENMSDIKEATAITEKAADKAGVTIEAPKKEGAGKENTGETTTSTTTNYTGGQDVKEETVTNEVTVNPNADPNARQGKENSSKLSKTLSTTERESINSISLQGSRGENLAGILVDGKVIEMSNESGSQRITDIYAEGDKLVLSGEQVVLGMGIPAEIKMGEFQMIDGNYMFTPGQGYTMMMDTDGFTKEKAMFASFIRGVEADPDFAARIKQSVTGTEDFKISSY